MKLIEREKNFMNTTITIKVVQHSEGTIEINNSINEAFGEFDRIVTQYTRFNENSELSNLNRRSGEWTKVSDEFFSLIEIMLNIAKETNGAFDPTIIDFLEMYGYDKNYDFSKLEAKDLEVRIKKRAIERPKFSEIELNHETRSVKLAKDQRIDLGGIGKGYAIDCAFDQLKKVSENFLIDGGGDIRASGKNDKEEIWKVGMKALNEKKEVETFGMIELNNESLASSGSWARKVKNFHHLINPATGEPVKADYNTVFVQAPTALLADSWATALFIDRNLEKKVNFKVLFV
jgi:thiamine biosynthesis lipoprotein